MRLLDQLLRLVRPLPQVALLLVGSSLAAAEAAESRFQLGAESYVLPLSEGQCDIDPATLDENPAFAKAMEDLKPYGGEVLALQLDCAALGRIPVTTAPAAVSGRAIVLPTHEGAPLLADDAALSQFHIMKSLVRALPRDQQAGVFAGFLDMVQRAVGDREIDLDCALAGVSPEDLGLSLCGESRETGEPVRFNLGAALRPHGDLFIAAITLTLNDPDGSGDFEGAAAALRELRRTQGR